MADISLKRAHQLGLPGARAAADKMAEKLSEKFDLAGDWKGNTLHFQRPGVTGTLSISETQMNLEVSLGFMLKMMRGPIEAAVHEQLDKVLTAPKAAKSTAPKPAKAPAPATGKAPAARKK